MFRKLVLITFGLVLVLSGCAGSQSGNETLTTIRLPMGYIPNIQYAPFYVAVEKGYFREAGIEIDFGNYAANKARLVGEQLFTVRSDVPGFYFAAQIFVEHRLEQEVVFIID